MGSHWSRPMRLYHPIILKCAACRKPVNAAVYDSARGAYVHPYDCTKPKGRPSREVRERLRRAAGV